MTEPSRTIPAELNDARDPCVLIVDDNEANLTAFEAVLAMPGIELVMARSGAEAMRHLLNTDFAAILLDINMPGLDGLQTARMIRDRDRTRDLPILFISAYAADQERIAEGYATGAVDYILKPVAPDILRSKVAVFVELYRKQRQVEWQAHRLREANASLQREADERREAQADALFEREERQRVTLQCIADGVITTNIHGRTTYLNAVAENLVGKSLDRVWGLRLGEVLSLVESGDQIDRQVEACLKEDRIVQCTEPRSLSGSPAFIEYSIAPIHHRRGAAIGTVCIVKDVTERRAGELERERLFALERQARSEAETANRTKDEFLGVVSHELRTPLNAIVGWAALLERSGDDQALRTRAIATIRRNALAQQRLIDDLLDTTRILSGKFALALQPLDLAVIVHNAVDAVRPLGESRGVAIEVERPSDDAPVHGDQERLAQVFSNLLTNALKFTSAGGTVHVDLLRTKERVTVRVTDTGEGIAAEFLPHVFDRFRQAEHGTTRRHRGLGLGLAIARQIVAMHRGEIRALSEGIGRGAQFHVTLPLLDTIWPENPPLAKPERFALDLTGVRILAVEDDAETRELLASVLGGVGAEVRTASSVAEARIEFATWRPDLLLSDISMPGEDGIALIEWVRARSPELGGSTPAAALTALVSEIETARLRNCGFERHLTKPVEPDTLIAAIVQLHEEARKRVAGT